MLGDVGDGLTGVVERTADIETLPRRGALTAQPEGAGDRVERAAQLKSGRRHDDGAVAKHLVPHQHCDTHRRHSKHRATPWVLAHPGHIELALLQEPLGILEDLVDRRARDLTGTVVVLGRCRLQLGLHSPGRAAHAGQGQRKGVRYAVQPPLGQLVDDDREELGRGRDLIGLGQTTGTLGCGGDHRGGQLVGDGGGHPVGELMALVDDEHVVLRQHLAALEGVDRHEAVVGHDHVDVPRRRARLLHEALGDHRALLAQALMGRDRHLTPGPLGDAGDELVAVAGLRLLEPLAEPDDLGPELGAVCVHGTDREQAALVVVGEAARELVLAQVVAAALHQGVGRLATQQRGDGLGQPGHVTVDDLGLQGQRRGGDHGR